MSIEPPSFEPLAAAITGTILAGLFACADAALATLSQARLEALGREANPRFSNALRRVSKLRDHIHARLLVGRVLSLALTSISLSLWLIEFAGSFELRLLIGSLALVLLCVVMELAVGVGRRGADWIVPPTALLFRPFELLLAPIAFLTRLLTQLMPGSSRTPNPRITEKEVELIVDQGARSGLIDEEPAEMIRNMLEFSDLTAKQVMVPRTRVASIKVDTPIEDVLRTITETGHSRYPVYRDEIDDVFGLLFAKDLFRVVKSSWRPPPPTNEEENAESPQAVPSSERIRLLNVVRTPINIVSESQSLSTLLRQMRLRRHHLAVVVDEFGSMSGIVTLEDILEEIVGDIQDESDDEQNPIVALGEGRFLADGAMLMGDLSSHIDAEIDADVHRDSIAGMITERLGQVPEMGTQLPAYGLLFIVRESDNKHIAKVEIVREASADAQHAS